MYRRLPHGPHGLDREDVARHQRARLYGAMIESIAQRGYAPHHRRARDRSGRRLAAGLLRAVRQQGRVLPGDLRHRRRALAQARARGVGSERGWANRLHASCKSFLDDIVAEPKGARLVLIDSLGIGSKARERLHLAGNAYERLVAAAFRVSPDTAPLPAIASRAIVGGVRHVVFNRIREEPRLRAAHAHRRTARLGRGLPLARHDAAERDRAQAATRDPAGAGGLPGERRQARAGARLGRPSDPRRRLRRTDRPPDRAVRGHLHRGLPQAVRDKEECFLTVVDEFASEALQAVEAAISPIASWADAVPDRGQRLHRAHRLASRAAADGVRRPLRSRPRHDRPHDQVDRPLHRHARRQRPRGAPRSRDRLRGDHRSGLGHHQRLLLAERMRYLPCLSDHIAFVVLAPYVGPKVAIDTIEHARLGAGRRRSLVAAAQLAAPPRASRQRAPRRRPPAPGRRPSPSSPPRHPPSPRPRAPSQPPGARRNRPPKPPRRPGRRWPKQRRGKHRSPRRKRPPRRRPRKPPIRIGSRRACPSAPPRDPRRAAPEPPALARARPSQSAPTLGNRALGGAVPRRVGPRDVRMPGACRPRRLMHDPAGPAPLERHDAPHRVRRSAPRRRQLKAPAALARASSPLPTPMYPESAPCERSTRCSSCPGTAAEAHEHRVLRVPVAGHRAADPDRIRLFRRVAHVDRRPQFARVQQRMCRRMRERSASTESPRPASTAPSSEDYVREGRPLSRWHGVISLRRGRYALSRGRRAARTRARLLHARPGRPASASQSSPSPASSIPARSSSARATPATPATSCAPVAPAPCASTPTGAPSR